MDNLKSIKSYNQLLSENPQLRPKNSALSTLVCTVQLPYKAIYGYATGRIGLLQKKILRNCTLCDKIYYIGQRKRSSERI